MTVNDQDAGSPQRSTSPEPTGADPTAAGPGAGTVAATSPGAGPGPTDALPSFPEQISAQLGGWRGMVEAAIPISVFIFINLVWEVLQPALIASAGTAVLIAIYRLIQRRPIRYAVNGLFGIGLGAIIAWRSGEARDFYLPGILISYGYAAGMILSVLVRHPLVGWLWSVLMDGGSARWRQDRQLMRTFTWLTMLWAAVWIAKVSVQAWLWNANEEHLLGIARLVLGAPPYLLLLAFTIWVVRRVQRAQPESGRPGSVAPEPAG